MNTLYWRTIGKRLALTLLAGLIVLSGRANFARADAMDAALRLRAPKLMQKIKDMGYRNVGVLRFRVQKGDATATFAAGLLNTAMATGLENALILVDNERSPIGITRDAGAVAAKEDRHATYLTPPGRRKLLEREYPLAWDNRHVKVDAFLAGIVRVSRDMRESTVVIEAFDQKNPDALREIDRFNVRNDLEVFSDLGAGYSVAKRDLRLVSDNGSDTETAPPRPHKTRQPDTALVLASARDDLAALDLIDFTVYYDDKPVRMTTRHGEYRIPSPSATTKSIRFDMASKTNKPVAVVVLVNGVNTVNGSEQGKSVMGYTKWILKDRQTYSITGIWSADGQTVRRFKVAGGAALARLSDLDPDKLGQIELFVFPTAATRTMLAQAEPPMNLKDRSETMRTDLPLSDVKRNIHRAALATNRRVAIVPGAREHERLLRDNVDNLGTPVYLIIHY